MGTKRKSLGQETAPKKRKASPSDVDSDLEAEIEQYAAHSTLVDPMIDPQLSDDDEDDDDESGDEDEEMASADGGDAEAAEAHPAHSTTPAAGPSRSRGLYAAPTLAELDALRSAEASGGNTFSLQLDELLSSTLLPTVPAPSLKTLLGALHDLVHALPALPPVPPRKAESRLGKGRIPFPGPKRLSPLAVKGKDEPKWTLGFEAPAEVVVAGAWPVCGGYKRSKGEAGGIDVVVVMPSAMFSAKDRTAYRYFHKRAHYLAVIAEGVKKAAGKKGALHGVSVRWEWMDARRPIVVIGAGKAQGLKHAVEVRVHAGIAPDVFPPATLYPSKSLIRAGDEAEATPHTAASIVHDTLHKAHLLQLHQMSRGLGDRVADKFLALWRIWALRRGFPRSRGGSGFFASMLLAWVVGGGSKGGKRVRGLGRGLGVWGALRAAWEFIANTDFEATPVFIAGADDAECTPHAQFTAAYKDVFVDPSGTLNVVGEWEKGDIELLRYHARETLAMLEDGDADHFADVFLHDHTLGPATYDEYMIVDVSEVSDSPSGVADAERPSLVERLAYRAADVVRRGLTDRARLVHVQVLSETQFAIGVLLNGSQATRVLDLGPAADREAECAAFRALWRDRAELRRFKDGSIAESVVWNVSRPEEGALIPGRAVRHLVSLHLGSDVVISAPSSEEAWLTILQTPASAREAVNVAGSEKLGFRPMMESYEGLYKLLKSVDDDMPLAILHVAPASELLRYASVFVPHPVDVARAAGAPACISYMPVAEVTLQFESSQRWPDDLAAVQKLKLALLEKLARVLAARERGLQAGIALDAGASDIDDAAALEVVMASGSAFRIRIHHDRERTLLERALEPPLPGIPRNLPPPPRRLVTPALALHQRRFNWAPAHHAALAPLHHRFPSFSTAARLLKRWAAAHLLSPHVGPEALELLTAHTYLDSGALAPPASATAGFLRTLAFLAEWDWRATPAFIPLAAVTRDAASASGRPRFPSEERQASLAAFARRPESDAWALATEADTAGTRWTGGVGRLVAGRVAALAAASLRLVRASTTDVHALDIPALFTTPTEHYDALLHLVPGTRAAQAVRLDPTVWESRLAFRNLQTDTTVRIAFDPVARFVADIQAAYGDTLLVFHDALGGDTLAILWNPAKQPRAFKPLVGFNARPAHTQAALVEVNRDAVLAEIARMGQGIVQRIETR